MIDAKETIEKGAVYLNASGQEFKVELVYGRGRNRNVWLKGPEGGRTVHINRFRQHWTKKEPANASQV